MDRELSNISFYPWMEAKLRLAFLKESARYRAFWTENGTADLSIWSEYVQLQSILAERPKWTPDGGYQELYGAREAEYIAALRREPAFSDAVRQLNKKLCEFGIATVSPPPGPEDVFHALDPYESNELPETLPIWFCDRPSPIMQVSINESPVEHDNCAFELHEFLMPHERVFVIDISRRKGEILEEMSRYLDKITTLRADQNGEFTENYDQWQPEQERKRKEGWQSLKVWKMRRQKKPFLAISKETGLSVPAAKKAFARSYELIEGRQYDQEKFKKIYQEIQSAEVKRTCRTCPERGNCTNPCPDVLPFIGQDAVPLAELLPNTPL